uniref:hypothetical protein n=1 Tax=Salmonella sp. TaxID=599 RepID=UPI001CDA1712|nr:hypothetical protein [Salmonella sp.]
MHRKNGGGKEAACKREKQKTRSFQQRLPISSHSKKQAFIDALVSGLNTTSNKLKKMSGGVCKKHKHT